MTLPSAILFDWDGTLADSWHVLTLCMNDTFSQFGLPIWSEEEFRQNATRSLRDNFPIWFGAEWEAARDVFYQHFAKRHLDCIKLLPHALDCLQWIKQREIFCAVVSNKQGNFLRREVEHLGIEPYFKAIVGAGDAAKDKPDAGVVRLALEGFEPALDSSMIWFVGDTDVDIHCARNSGCFSVFIGKEIWADTSVKPDMICEDMGGFLQQLKKQFN